MSDITPIAYIETPFDEKFGVPRQSGIADCPGRIVLAPAFRDCDAVRGLEGFSHIWLLWQFDRAAGHGWSPTVRPPRLGGNERVGVFASRSPFRPNGLGLSAVELEHVSLDEADSPVLYVRGADMVSGTPIFDIKPYLPYVDAYPDARGGFTDTTKEYALQVVCPDALLCKVPENKRAALSGVLKNDPRPAYQHDPERVYTLDFGENKVKFSVDGDVLTVREIL